MQIIHTVSRLKLMEIMNRLDFFDEFTGEERSLLLEDKLQVYSCRKGRAVTREGESDTAFYLLLSGSLRVEKGKQELGTVTSGQFIGEGAFVTRRPRSASAIAAEDSILLRLDNKALRSLGAVLREKVKDAIIVGMAKRIVHLNERLGLTRL